MAQEDPTEEARQPYEQLGRRQSEVQFGVVRSRRDAANAHDVQTDSASAFIAYSRGFSNRFEVGAVLPYVLYAEQTAVNSEGATVRAEERYGVSDPTLRVRYALKGEGANVAVTLGMLMTPSWGGRDRAFTTDAAVVEPFVVFGRRLGRTQLYLRYGYAWRSGDTPEEHKFVLGGRHPLGRTYGVLATLSYKYNLGSATDQAHGIPGGSLGGYVTLVNRMQLVGWVSQTGYNAQTTTGRIDDSRTRQFGFSLVHRL